MPEASVISSEEVFALQMVRPTFGLFNHIRKKHLADPSRSRDDLSLAIGGSKRLLLSCDRQHKSWKNTESQYREGRCPGAWRYCSLCCYVS